MKQATRDFFNNDFGPLLALLLVGSLCLAVLVLAVGIVIGTVF